MSIFDPFINMEKRSFSHSLSQKTAKIEIMSFGQSHGLTPLENVLFMAFFSPLLKRQFFGLTMFVFYPEY